MDSLKFHLGPAMPYRLPIYALRMGTLKWPFQG
jgi:hypothetical protein